MQNDFDDPASAGEHATRERDDDDDPVRAPRPAAQADLTAACRGRVDSCRPLAARSSCRNQDDQADHDAADGQSAKAGTSAIDQRDDHGGSDSEKAAHGGADVRRAWRGSVQRGARGAATIDGADADGVRRGAVSGRRRPQAAPMDSDEAGPAAARGSHGHNVRQRTCNGALGTRRG